MQLQEEVMCIFIAAMSVIGFCVFGFFIFRELSSREIPFHEFNSRITDKIPDHELAIIDYFRENMTSIDVDVFRDLHVNMYIDEYSYEHYCQFKTGKMNYSGKSHAFRFSIAGSNAMKKIAADATRYQINSTITAAASAALKNRDYSFITYRYESSAIEFRTLAREENGSWYNKDGILINWFPGITVEAA